ncbi:MAG TPA: transcriptional activator NhaR [Terriglobales bacterium]|nr:transcriptional activator NhaR [Terriglobales bacterium]
MYDSMHMEWLNYHHLYYFWTVAREGSIAKASKELRLAQPTISGQLRVLENVLGEKLFQKAGRNLILTDVGRMAYRYAEEIFRLGRELQDTIGDRPTGRPVRFNVGVADAVPKLIAYRLLKPAMKLDQPIRIVCREGKPDRLIAALSIHELDLVISDAPLPPTVNVRAFSHLLGESGITFFAPPKLVGKGRFPKSLDGIPFFGPAENTTLRRNLDQWFQTMNLHPAIIGEFEDSALMTAFGQSGEGAFVAPTVIEKEIERQFGVKRIGRVPEVKESFYAISVERRLKHPAVLAISASARAELFK